ncbi:FtsW/RodA/SpoVE family cell cycle protein [Adlercreutzia faecimuris]|uniref:Probable peptidoglycan glycosyltransferase FtsW n=1 Tax=Adlercreutzia faecimuris TaxID=2897341 RepID=A0ABS9WGN4_9ACTN|nr:FtsW/RodA/SpoVE family cell cycle protein [Adlercreutzia sp. JBNU-10]MCI2241740.1 FtsW/RodA/SpoVE family cell cycle protein [Adlercreutzia sp. JBNU-10]
MAVAGKRGPSPEVVGPRAVLLLCVLSLLLIGLVMVYSAGSIDDVKAGHSVVRSIQSQALYAGVGVVCAAVVWRFIPVSAWTGPLVWAVWGVAVVMLGLTAVIGTEIYGARRWLGITETIGIQPSEFAKIALLLMAVRILCLLREGSLEPRAAVVQAIVLVMMPLGFLYVTQSDLGTTLICFVGIYAVMWVGGVPGRLMGAIAVAGVALAAFAVFGTGYRSGRMVYLDPWNDGEGGYGDGFNIIRSYYALAEGGLLGVGLGNSREKFGYLFASDSDFIFAIIGEELGMVGALVVIGLFVAFLVAGLRIAQGAPDDLGRMVAGGCTIMLVAQAFLNIGCTIGVLPTTGKPLPFISSGGSSILATMIMVGLILSVSRAQDAPTVYEQRRADLRVVRAERPAPPERPSSRAPRR